MELHGCPYALRDAIYQGCPRLVHGFQGEPCEGCSAVVAEKTYWNGEPCQARRVRVIVGDAEFPAYWARAYVGQERAAVEVTYGDQKFYIDNEHGDGWLKVTIGRGRPRWGFSSLGVERVVEYLTTGQLEQLTGLTINADEDEFVLAADRVYLRGDGGRWRVDYKPTEDGE